MTGSISQESLTQSKRLTTLKVFIKPTILICLLIFTHEVCRASKVAGYIITENSDTLYGEIRVSHFDRITGGWIFNGFEQVSFHYEVFFREKGKSRFSSFTPKDIQAFGFSYKSTDYIFRRFAIATKNIFKKEQKRYRFLCLEYNGRISLYQDMVYVIKNTNNITQSGLYMYYEFYLYNDSKGLKKIELTKHTRSLTDLLLFYGIEKDFLEKIPSKADLWDIKTILAEYDNWCNRRLTMECKPGLNNRYKLISCLVR
jgi:hypothetical protein